MLDSAYVYTAPKHLRTVGLRKVTRNMAALRGIVQAIDYSRYKCHALSDWSMIVL